MAGVTAPLRRVGILVFDDAEVPDFAGQQPFRTVRVAMAYRGG